MISAIKNTTLSLNKYWDVTDTAEWLMIHNVMIMPIVLVDYQFFPILKFSGISRYFFELISNLSSFEKTEISLYMGWHVNEYNFKDLSQKLKHFFSIKRPRLPKTGRIFDFLNVHGFNAFASFSKANIYHQTYYKPLLPNFKGVRTLTVYDLIYYKYPKFFEPNDPGRDQIRESISKATKVIAISEATKRDIVQYLKVPEDKIQVIYLANGLNACPSEVSPLGRPYILYVGQRFGWKNFKLLLNTYAESKEINSNFDLVCFGGFNFSNDENQLMQKYNIVSKVHRFVGPDEILATFYKHARLLVYPSLYEGFGLPILESMHYACPVLCSDRASIPEVAGDASIYFNPEEQEDLYDKLSHTLYNDDLVNSLKKRGNEQEKKFSWEMCAKETHEFYKSMT